MNRNMEKIYLMSNRIVLIIIANILVFAVLFGRLYFLQVYEAGKYKTMSDENRISTRFLLSPRGVIYDRNGEIIAKNEQDFQAMLVAEQTPDIQGVVDKFSEIIELDKESKEKIEQSINKRYRFIPVRLKNNLSWQEVSKLMLHSSDLAGLEISEGLSRKYPYGNIYAHVLGYVGPVSEKEKNGNPLYMVPGFKLGKSGLEKYFDERLRGISGSIKLEVNAFGRVMNEIERDAGVQGENITTTLDTQLQKVAYEAFGDNSGAAVVLNVNTGEILALVSTPSFDPNLFTNGISYKNWNELLNNERTPLINKAVSGQYSPGSTFKIVVALAALEAGVITPSTRIYCNGSMEIGNARFHCWKHSGHGSLNVVEALKHSCDIFFYEAAMRVGIDRIKEMAVKLGMNEALNVGLDNEKSGLIPNMDWKYAKYGTNWTKGDSANSGIGQGYVLVTPIQLATMLARVVNGGYEIKPTFIKPTEKDLANVKRLNISTRNIEIVKQGMYEVVNGHGGTASRAKINVNGAKMGGKTGTTQVRRISMKERAGGVISDSKLPWNLRNHALFVGFAPVDNPKYAVAVVVEHGSSGSGVAAPIAGKILNEALLLDIK